MQTGGYDTHAVQGSAAPTSTLMTTLERRFLARSTPTVNQGLLNDTLVLQFSEFGRRISENGSQGTDHGAASVMMPSAARCAAASTARRPRSIRLQSDAREQRRRCQVRNRFPAPSAARCYRQLAGSGFSAGVGRRLSQRRPQHPLARDFS